MFIWIASAQYAAPVLRNSLDKMQTLDIISILERLMKLSTISLVIWLAGFFVWLCEIGITSATTCFRAQSVARESNSERELVQTESPVDFPCKLSRMAISHEDSAPLLYLIWT